nr:MAG TPA: hypothetical protein [Caudoviricetes sp.]
MPLNHFHNSFLLIDLLVSPLTVTIILHMCVSAKP